MVIRKSLMEAKYSVLDPDYYMWHLIQPKKAERIQRNHCCHDPAFMQKGTVKYGNTVIGINIVTSLSKFLTGHNPVQMNR
jgi:hypothetical protein